MSLLRNFWARLIAPSDPKPVVPPVVVIDPEEGKPHDLDDPFFDRTVQSRMADVIAHAGQQPKK